MAEAIEYEQFDRRRPRPDARPTDADLSRLSDIPMELSVEIGRTHMTVGETLDLRVGSVVALERQAGEPADLLVNGTAIARGEVIVVDERYGLRVTEILESNQIACSPGTGGSTAGEAGAHDRRHRARRSRFREPVEPAASESFKGRDREREGQRRRRQRRTLPRRSARPPGRLRAKGKPPTQDEAANPGATGTGAAAEHRTVSPPGASVRSTSPSPPSSRPRSDAASPARSSSSARRCRAA